MHTAYHSILVFVGVIEGHLQPLLDHFPPLVGVPRQHAAQGIDPRLARTHLDNQTFRARSAVEPKHTKSCKAEKGTHRNRV